MDMATSFSAYSSHDSTLITPPSTSSSNCVGHQNDSDCGSCSGFGGMPNHDISDEAASSTSSHRPQRKSSNSVVQPQPPPPLMPLPQQHAVPPSMQTYTHNPLPLPTQLQTIPYHHQQMVPQYNTQMMASQQHALYTVPPPNMQGGPPPPQPPQHTNNGVPPWMGNVSNGPANSIFVHVQSGETLTLYNSGEPQHITGPASIKMVSEGGFSNLPLPVTVTPGHQCHQFVDELGILRHVVLSLEPPNSRTQYPREMNVPQLVQPTPSTSTTPALPAPAISPSQPIYNGLPQNGLLQTPPNFQPVPQQPLQGTSNNNNSNISNNNYSARKWIPRLPITQENYYVDVDLPDPEENERFKKLLGLALAPTIELVLTSDVEVKWRKIDFNDPMFAGVLPPHADPAEIIYCVSIYESTGRHVGSYPCEPTAGGLRVSSLRPNTDYYVHVKVTMEDRGIYGDPSPHLFFRTAPGRPEPPLIPTLMSRTSDSVHLSWRPSVNNGAAVNLYNVYVEPLGEEGNSTVLQFGDIEAKINGLKPATAYSFRITSLNALGESYEASMIEVTTRPEGYPLIPLPPAISSVSHRAVRLNWLPIVQCTYGIEMNDVIKGTCGIVRDRLTGCMITIGDLTPNSEYHFRLIARHQEGEVTVSEWISIRTHQQRYQNNYSQPPPSLVQQDMAPRVPTNPVFIRYVNRKTEMGWKCYGQITRDNVYNLEGASYSQPNKFRSIYRGPALSCVIQDDEIQYVRVQAISKRGVASDFSEKMVVPRPDVSRPEKPDKMAAPELTMISRGKLQVSWKRITNRLRPKSVVTYMLQEIDSRGEPTPIYSGGDDEYIIENVPSETKITMRIRAMVIWNDTTVSGDWSETRSIHTPRSLPLPPYDIEYVQDKNMLAWKCNDKSSDMLYFIEVVECSTDDVTKYDTRDKFIFLKSLHYAEKYSIYVRSSHGGGDCVEVQTFELETPADIPSQPQAVTIAAESLRALTVRWTSAENHGSPIISYRLIISKDNQFIKEAAVVGYDNEYILTDLEPSTVYKVELYAENSVGTGPSVTINGRTKELPPVSPKLECEPEATAMRLRWKNTSSAPLVYKLVRLRNEQQITVYEGENLTSRVKNLSQDTDYTFQIRATNRYTGTSVWSEPTTFRTLLAPPPTVRIAPTATQSTTMIGYHHVEWSNVLPTSSSVKQFYRLQVVEANDSTARWHTVYEGPKPSFNLKSNIYKSALHLRVFCVRMEPDGETKSQTSPVTYILNEQLELKEKEVEDDDNLPKTFIDKIKYKLDYKQYSLTTSALVFIGLICILYFCDYLYNITENSGPPTPMAPIQQTQSTYTPSPPQPAGNGIHVSISHRDL
ncbi:unnamed protein product [Caenorhabditis angaria]|uniref:Fibronectin type-III domain-containing protein n=1 Tax=Caenorhabditis angaria TaxID=860376 RepID=A0A9P1NBV1_9PELO|nr:unnamed protein product [Caenorhabditis angaria]